LQEYWIDAWQRSILLLDTLRPRGNNYVQHNARIAPHVLSFDAELVLDGRSLARPVNYGLVRIVTPKNTRIVDAIQCYSFVNQQPSPISEGRYELGFD